MKTSFPKNKIRILLLENIHPAATEDLREAGFDVETRPGALKESELVEAIGGFHLLGIRSKTRVTKRVIEKADKLLTIGCFCIGTDQVELLSARGSGIPVFNAPYSNTRSVAEMILAEMICLSRQLFDRSSGAHSGAWDKSALGAHEIRGKTLGIVGYGHIGSQLSVLSESLGMEVVFYDIVKKLPLGNARQMSTLSDLLKKADFVSLHVPDTQATRGLIGGREIELMKQGAYLLNASRGLVVDLAELAGALKSKKLSGAAIDVFPEEPANNEERFVSPLQGVPNVILTPHVGGSTEEAQEAIGREVAASFIKFVNDGSTVGAVNFPKVALPVQEDAHRILNVHRNVPGVLSDINRLVSDAGANILGQYLATDDEIGYMVMDLERAQADLVCEGIRGLSTNIRTRILY